jgi:GT2 family glycosyltransferase/glycosyltransferase involved in cell wall biosynthesis
MRVLLIAHGFPPSGTGGAELYVESLAAALAAAGDHVAVLAREHEAAAPEFRVRRDDRGPIALYWINNTFGWTTAFADTYRHAAIDAAAAGVIDDVRPDVAHVHHLTGLSTTILDELGRRNIPVVLTLHDYWMLCHRGQLFDETMTACAGPGVHGCQRCTGRAASTPAAFGAARFIRRVAPRLPRVAAGIRRVAEPLAHRAGRPEAARRASRLRLSHMRERFTHVTVALAPSGHVRRRFEQAGFPASVIRISEYGVVPGGGTAPTSGTRLRLGYLGAMMASKAPHLLADAIAAFSPCEVTADFFGAPAAYHGDHRYSDGIMARLAGPGVTVRGPVPHAELTRVFAAIDVLVFPSVWEETSGIGAREALAAGIPVIASRIGGIPETVRHDVNGLLFEPGDTADLARQIRRLVDDPALLPRLRRGCSAPRTLEDDVRSTRALYQEAITCRRGRARDGVPRRSRTAAVVLNYGTPDQTALATQCLLRSEPAAADVVVVDNGDGHACGQALDGLATKIAFRVTGGNLGFSGGCNVGIAEALGTGADAIWLVNSDVLVPPDCLERLLAALRDRPGVAIAAPVVRSRAWPERVLSAGLDYDTWSGRVLERAGIESREPVTSVPAVSGCAMLVRREVFEAIGLLPEEYFFSFEDIAFCQRARRAGFGVAVVTGASVYHEGSGTMGARAERLYYAARNHLRLGAETPAASKAHRWGRQLAIASYNFARVVTSTDGSLASRTAAVTRGVVDHVLGRDARR